VSRYIIVDGVILSCVNEMDTTNHVKFGEGLVKDGENEAVRVWIEPANESSGRGVLPFASMICADAYLWAARRGFLAEAFRRWMYGTVPRREL
jgi:hypothetical protein